MAISLTQLGNVQHSIVNKYWKFHVIASSNIGSLLQHHFIYAELEELYLVNPKKFWFYSSIQKHWKIQNYKIRKIGIKKAISNSKSYSSKRKKIWQYIWRAIWYHCLLYCRYNIYCTRKHKFHCFWSSMLTKKKSKSNVAKSCAMEKFVKVLIIFLQGCCQPRDKWFEGLLNFNHFRKLDTAWNVAKEQMNLV